MSSVTDLQDDFRWHTGNVYPTEFPDAVEFIDTHKAFGRNKILRGADASTTSLTARRCPAQAPSAAGA